MREKRKNLRFSVFLDAQLKKARSRREGQEGSAVNFLKVKDLSREGVGIISGSPLPKGEDVELEMNIPGDNIPVIVSGEIAWAGRLSTDEKCYEGGLKMSKISKNDRNRLLNFVYNKLIKQGKKDTEE